MGHNRIKADCVLLFLEDSDTDSGDDGGISEGGESNVSEYKETSVVGMICLHLDS